MPTPKPSPRLVEWLTERVEYSIGGRAWPLIFTHRALLSCEKLTGVDMLAANMAAPSAVLLRGLLFSALSCIGCECSLGEVGRSITRGRLRSVRATVVQAWAASMPEPEPDEGQERGPAKKLTWMDAWAMASSRHGLGLSDDRWLDMTPRQVAALHKVRLEQMQREELLVGIISSTVENFSQCHPEKPVAAVDFMLHKFPAAETEQKITGEYIMAQMSKGRKRR